MFHGLDTLIEYYKINRDGLPCKLTEPCPGGSPLPLYTLKCGQDTALHNACVDGNVQVCQLVQKHPE